ncbi:MAG: hypothetical protein ACHBN1_28230 [Heteroscytonema crispum UTEX LB 1556]
MLERILLAAFITFTLSLFTNLSWSSSAQTAQEMHWQNNKIVFSLAQRLNLHN